MVASSRYQTLMDGVTDLAMSSMERSRRTGPIGSPYCVPDSDMMTPLPKINSFGLAYAETARRNKDRALLVHTSTICPRRTLLDTL